MVAETAEAYHVLENAIFGNIDNQLDDDDYLITFEGDNFVLAHYDTGELYHFKVSIEPHEWDSRQALEDQEWEVQ